MARTIYCGIIKISLAFVFFLGGVFLPFFPHVVHGAGVDANGYNIDDVVRVGFPIQAGLSEKNPDGSYSGYNYEYLREIAQYTGWKYEFVEPTSTDLGEGWEELTDKLEKGEIDLLGSVLYVEEYAKKFNYVETNYGRRYDTLSILSDNAEISENDLFTMRGKKIGVRKGATSSNGKLEKFLKSNGLFGEVELVEFESDETKVQALREKRIDVLLGKDVIYYEGTRVVSRFSESPFYFITQKENYALANVLNGALQRVVTDDPYFTTTLYQKYFPGGKNLSEFTEWEKQYIEDHSVLKIADYAGVAPLQAVNKNGEKKGISYDIFDLFSQRTGISLEYIHANSRKEALELLRDGKADMAPGIIYDYDLAEKYDFSLTRPYLTSQMILVSRDGVNPYDLNGKRLALVDGQSYNGAFLGEVLFTKDIEASLNAIVKGDADYCYINSYSMEYYCGQKRFRKLERIPQTNNVQRFCLAVSRGNDSSELVALVNKTVNAIAVGELESIIFDNLVNRKEITVAALIENNPMEFVLITAIVVIVILGVLLWMIVYLRRSRQKFELENERYKMLSRLAGEQIFEYQYRKDKVTFPNAGNPKFDVAAVNGVENVGLTFHSMPAWLAQLYQKLHTEKDAAWEYQAELADGKEHWLSVSFSTVVDSAAKPVYAIGKVLDIEQERNERDKLFKMAQTDGLTGLYNATACRNIVETLLRESYRRTCAFCIMDVDDFKTINDKFGHMAGDEVLRQMAEILRSLFANGEILSRAGGDEFIVFMQNEVSYAGIQLKCRELLDRARTAFSDKNITLSIGVAMLSGSGNYENVYRAADRALYAVKNRGRNGFEITML